MLASTQEAEVEGCECEAGLGNAVRLPHLLPSTVNQTSGKAQAYSSHRFGQVLERSNFQGHHYHVTTQTAMSLTKSRKHEAG